MGLDRPLLDRSSRLNRGLVGRSGGGLGGGLGLQAKVVENVLGGLGLSDHRQELAATSAARAMKHIDREDSAKKRRPIESGTGRRRRLCRGGVFCG